MIAIGSKAPDFTLKDQDGKSISLSGFKGKRVLLSFRPLAWTPICQDQMRLLEEHYQEFEQLNTIPLGIGVDSAPSNKAWGKTMNIKNLKLLADFWPHGAAAKAYDAFRENDGFAERANIVVDENQKIIWGKVYPTSQLPDIEEVIKFLNK